jgi:hypothetical protein
MSLVLSRADSPSHRPASVRKRCFRSFRAYASKCEIELVSKRLATTGDRRCSEPAPPSAVKVGPAASTSSRLANPFGASRSMMSMTPSGLVLMHTRLPREGINDRSVLGTVSRLQSRNSLGVHIAHCLTSARRTSLKARELPDAFD